jgi:hypothetical protein
VRPSGSAPPVRSSDGGRLLNYSQIAEWTRCRHRWHLGARRHIQARHVVRNLELGSAVHIGIAAAWRIRAAHEGKAWNAKHDRRAYDAGKDAIALWKRKEMSMRGGDKQMLPEERELLDALTEESAIIVERTIRWLRMDRWVVVRHRQEPMCELGLTIPDPRLRHYGWDGFHFTPDVVITDLEDGTTLVADYKVREQFTRPEAEEVNLQLMVYQYNLRRIGVPVDGTCMMQVRNRAPSAPSLNQNGSMSRQRIATDWVTYRNALIANGLDPKQYLEMREKLDVVFHQEDRVYHADEEVDAAWNQIVLPVARSINREADRPYRTMNVINCNGCWARDICLAELRGDDIEFLLQTKYVDMENPQARLILNPEDVDFHDDREE